VKNRNIKCAADETVQWWQEAFGFKRSAST
jgi:hypothetical protein